MTNGKRRRECGLEDEKEKEGEERAEGGKEGALRAPGARLVQAAVLGSLDVAARGWAPKVSPYYPFHSVSILAC